MKKMTVIILFTLLGFLTFGVRAESRSAEANRALVDKVRLLNAIRDQESERAEQYLLLYMLRVHDSYNQAAVNFLNNEVSTSMHSANPAIALEFFEYNLDIAIVHLASNYQYMSEADKKKAITSLSVAWRYRNEYPRKYEAEIQRRLKNLPPALEDTDVDYVSVAQGILSRMDRSEREKLAKWKEKVETTPCTCVFNKNRSWNPATFVWKDATWVCAIWKEDGSCAEVKKISDVVAE